MLPSLRAFLLASILFAFAAEGCSRGKANDSSELHSKINKLEDKQRSYDGQKRELDEAKRIIYNLQKQYEKLTDKLRSYDGLKGELDEAKRNIANLSSKIEQLEDWKRSYDGQKGEFDEARRNIQTLTSKIGELDEAKSDISNICSATQAIGNTALILTAPTMIATTNPTSAEIIARLNLIENAINSWATPTC